MNNITKTKIVKKAVAVPKAKAVSVQKVPEPIVEPIVERLTEKVPEPIVERVTEKVSMKQRFESLIKSRQEQTLQLKREIQELRKMQRDHELEIKEASKKRRKSKRDNTTPRKPSGFASPVVVSDTLYNFLDKFGVKKTDLVARTDVTKYITTYIRDNNLQNPEHRREIIPDAELLKVFGPPIELKDETDPTSPKVYTYLRLQKYLSQHFPKKQTPTF